jgi:tetratricopeptide (TPR) repeat protein
MFFVASRYRLPAVPLLSLYAAYGLTWLFDTYNRRAWRQAVAGTVAGALLVVFVKLNLTIPVQPAWEPHMSLGVIYRSLNKPSAAIADLRIASRLVEGSSDWVVYTRADIANKLGMLYGQVGKTDSSRAYLDTAIALVPDFDNAWFNRAVTCLQAGDNACAFESAWNALRLGNPHPDIASLALVALHRALPPDSIALEAAGRVGAAATQSAILNFVAMRRAYKGDTRGAVAILEQALAVLPADPTTRANLTSLGRAPVDSIAPQAFAQAQSFWLALQEAKAGKVGAALILLQQAARFGEHPVVLTHLGAAWARLGNKQVARDHLQRALALKPDFAPARQMIAMVDSMPAQPTGR